MSRAALLAALACSACAVVADCPIGCDAARSVVKDHCPDVVVTKCDDHHVALVCAPSSACLVDACYDTLGATVEDVGGCP